MASFFFQRLLVQGRQLKAATTFSFSLSAAQETVNMSGMFHGKKGTGHAFQVWSLLFGYSGEVQVCT